MNFIFDIGNTTAKFAQISDSGHPEEVITVNLGELDSAFTRFLVREATLAIVASSGSQTLQESFVQKLRQMGVAALELKQDDTLPFESKYAAGQAGIDRLANVAAAIEIGRLPAIVVDAGSAITFEVVGPDSVFRGGAILPGIRLQAEALRAGTARLPQVSLKSEVSAIGTDTEAAIQSGILHGCAGAIERLLQIMMYEPGMASASVVITGGDGPLLTRFIQREDFDVMSNLTIRGLYLLARHQYPNRFI